MSVPAIRSLDDVRDIESKPYEAFMPHGTVLAALAQVAIECADRPALTWLPSADPTAPCVDWTYERLMTDIIGIARVFSRLAGDLQPRVALLLPAVPQAYLALWAAEAVGVACPINHLLGQPQIARLIDVAAANILVAAGPMPELDIWSRVEGLRERCPSLRHIVVVGLDPGAAAGVRAPGAHDLAALLDAASAAPLDASAASLAPPGAQAGSPDALAALFHTGGTTGHPKLARHTHRNQLHAAWSASRMFGATSHDVILNGFPLFHVAGSFVYGLSILLAGGRIVLPTATGLRNPQFVRSYWKHVERHRVTLLAAVPTVMSTLLGVATDGEELSSVRCLLTGGSPLPAELADSFERRLGIPVRNILGMTECVGTIAIEPAGAERVAGSVGLPLPFTRVEAVDDAGAPLPAGVDGVLRVSGPHVGPGYVDAADDAGTFGEGGALLTGDIGHVDASGRVFVTGRAKDLIIRSGHNIDPVAIEEALLRHPDVLMAAAVGAPDEYAGELPVAYVSPRPGASIDAEALSAFVRQYVPERPAWPRRIVVLDALPVTAIGKVFKPALRAQATRAVIEERLAALGLASSIHVDVTVERNAQVVRLHGERVLEAATTLRRMMAPFGLRWRLESERMAGEPDPPVPSGLP